MKSFIVLVLLAFSLQSFGHSGNTDASGCHHDRKNGGYHCHNSKSSPNREVSSQNSKEMVSFNTKSKKYHRPGCKSAKSCTVNCIPLKKGEAIKRGGAPCGNCGG